MIFLGETTPPLRGDLKKIKLHHSNWFIPRWQSLKAASRIPQVTLADQKKGPEFGGEKKAEKKKNDVRCLGGVHWPLFEIS